MSVLSFDPERRRNAGLIAECAQLGYLKRTDLVLDPTYGLGNWWKDWSPDEGCLVRHDKDPDKAPDGPVDFTRLPYRHRTFDAVAYDPPYKLNGRPDPEVDGIYGVDERAKVDERLDLMLWGLAEAARVTRTRGIVLAKCQDQVVSGNVVWQTRILADEAEKFMNMRLIDAIHVSSFRAQPPNRRQIHARRNYSTLLVFKVRP